MTAPCKGCEYRSIHCHATCKKYKSFVEERQRIRQKRKEEAISRDSVIERAIKANQKYWDNRKR